MNEEVDTPNVSRKEYRQHKQTAVEFEVKNYNAIAIIPCSGSKGWFEMGDNSALLYSYVICKTLGLKNRIQGDQDSFYNQFSVGRVRVSSVEKLRAELKKSGYYGKEVEKNGCYVFRLNRKVTEKQMEAMREKELIRQATNDRIVETAAISPQLHQKLTHLSLRLHQTCPKMDKWTATTNGTRMLTLADGTMEKYYEICKAKYIVAPSEKWEEMMGNLDVLLCEMQVVSEVKLCERKKIYDIGQIALEAQNFLRVEIKKSKEWEKKHATTRHRESDQGDSEDGVRTVVDEGDGEGVRGGAEGETKN